MSACYARDVPGDNGFLESYVEQTGTETVHFPVTDRAGAWGPCDWMQVPWLDTICNPMMGGYMAVVGSGVYE